mgnify:CR=1 FL=1
MGMEGFADRARRELLATGETVRKRTVETPHRSHGPGGPDRQAGPGRAHQPGDRQPAVHQPPHRRVAPGQRLHQAGHHLTQRPPLTPSPEPPVTSRAVVNSPQRLPDAAGSKRTRLAPPVPVPGRNPGLDPGCAGGDTPDRRDRDCMNETRDRCGPAVRAVHRAESTGVELYPGRHRGNRLRAGAARARLDHVARKRSSTRMNDSRPLTAGPAPAIARRAIRAGGKASGIRRARV